MKIRVVSSLPKLAADLVEAPRTLAKELQTVVRDGAKAGNLLAKESAVRTAGKHGKHYPRSFSSEANPAVSAFGATHFSAVYGPDAAKPQGGMSFEYGSRNQPPHLDLSKSADVIGPSLGQEVRGAIDKAMW